MVRRKGCGKSYQWPAVALLAMSVLTACSDPKVESQELTAKAEQYVSSASLREASIELKNALQLDANNAQARFLLGKINMVIGDPIAAQKDLSRAKELGLFNDEVGVLLAQAMLQQADYKGLVNDTSFTSLGNTAQANIKAMQAIAHSALNDDSKAKETLSEAEAQDVQAVWVLLVRTRQQMVERDMESAQKTIQKAIDIHPSNQDVWLLKAELAEVMSDRAAAAQALQKVVELEPAKITTSRGWRANIGLAKMALADNKNDDAARILSQLKTVNPNNPELAYLQGLLAFKQTKLDVAEQNLLQVLKVAPEHPPSRLLMGTIQLQKNNYEQAVSHLSSYVQNEPSNIEARKLLGRAYIALGQPKEAQAILRSTDGKAVDSEVIALLGLSELQGGQKAEGIDSLKKAIKAAPDDTRIRFTLARAYIADGKVNEAIAELNQLVGDEKVGKSAEMMSVIAYISGKKFDQALTLANSLKDKNQGDAAVVALLASVYLAKNDAENGRKYLEEAVALKSDFTGALMELAALDEREGKLDQAKEHYQQVVNLSEAPTAALIALARISARSGDVEATGQWLSKSRESAPDQVLPQVLLAEHYLRQNKVEQADSVVQDLIKTNPQHPSTLALQGQLLMIKNQYNQALKPLLELEKIAPKAVLSNRYLGEAYFGLKDYKKGAEYFEKLLEVDKQNLVALNNLAWYYDTQNDSRALAYAEEAYKLQNNNPAVQDTLGWILVKKGDVRRGHDLLSAAAAGLKDVPEITYHLAVAKIKLGQPEGVSMLEQLIASGKEFDGKQDAKQLLDAEGVKK